MGYVAKVRRLLMVIIYGISLLVGTRDVLNWPGAFNPSLPQFRSTFEDDQTQVRLGGDLHARLSTLLETFCPNLNCLQAACPMHSM